MICTGCPKVLIPRPTWAGMTRTERKQVSDTHAREDIIGYCRPCYEHAKRHGLITDPNAWTGGWVLVGLIKRPAGPRPIEREREWRFT